MSPLEGTDRNYTDRQIREASAEQLEQWAETDPNAYNRRLATDALRIRKANRESIERARQQSPQIIAFDPRTEISADARYIARQIVKHLWILFVLLPVVVGVLLALLGMIK